MTNRSIIDSSGQTLVEVMVALFVLTAGLLGILSLLAQSIAISKETTDETIATYLAEEGLELARNVVDHDMYQRVRGYQGWSQEQGYVDPTFQAPGDYYQLDYTFCSVGVGLGSSCPSLSAYNANKIEPLDFDPEIDLYGYPEDLPVGDDNILIVTPYTRDIHVAYGENADGSENTNWLIVDSIVTWSTGAFTSQTVDLEDYFYNWHP